ncbi:hypothetical protein PPF1_40 [Rhizobium phage vB_RleM_PPF1]|nr:hypothetical protein PPF1_40 [Rhizobium phage vB_RleM_PPF1]AID18353.1 hypothetical protein PPF1_40 [Rhizobium phage vB_RleM_PPF1]
MVGQNMGDSRQQSWSWTDAMATDKDRRHHAADGQMLRC